MIPATSKRVTDWSRERPRTLIVKDGAIWMWPGVPARNGAERDCAASAKPLGPFVGIHAARL